MEELAVEAILRFIKEDVVFEDVTSESIIPPGCRVRAVVVAEEAGVIAGNKFVVPTLKKLGLEVLRYVEDGQVVEKDGVVLEVRGEARTILAIERTVLNFLMLLSGIASYTKRIVEKVRSVNSRAVVAATRKTHPGLAYFEKYAVTVGGGSTHRFGLFDMVLIKDNHLAIVGSIAEAVSRARRRHGLFKKIEVETRTPEEALEAARAGADVVMLDNFSVEEVARAIELLRNSGLRDKVVVEVSGGIDEDNIVHYAMLDVDVISLSRITLNAPPLGMHLDIVEVEECG